MDNEKLLLATGDVYSGAFVIRNDVAWPDHVKDDGQRDTAVGNWRQSPAARKAEKIE